MTRKTQADRDTQFRHIARQRRAFVSVGNPRISIDTKQREPAGNFKNPGRRWCLTATSVKAQDFPSDAIAQAVPFGIFDPELNRGHLCVGTSGNAADSSSDAVRDRRRRNGRRQYRDAAAPLNEANDGGSNGATSR